MDAALSSVVERVASLARPPSETASVEDVRDAVAQELSQAPLVADVLAKLLYRMEATRSQEEDLRDSLRRVEQQDARMEGENVLLQNQVRILEQDLGHLETQRKHEHLEHRRECQRWTEHRDDLQKRLNRLDGRDAAHAANLRRSEVQYVKLQKQLKTAQQQANRAGSGAARDFTVVTVSAKGAKAAEASSTGARRPNGSGAARGTGAGARRSRPSASAAPVARHRARNEAAGATPALQAVSRALQEGAEAEEERRCDQLLRENLVLRDEAAALRTRLETLFEEGGGCIADLYRHFQQISSTVGRQGNLPEHPDADGEQNAEGSEGADGTADHGLPASLSAGAAAFGVDLESLCEPVEEMPADDVCAQPASWVAAHLRHGRLGAQLYHLEAAARALRARLGSNLPPLLEEHLAAYPAPDMDGKDGSVSDAQHLARAMDHVGALEALVRVLFSDGDHRPLEEADLSRDASFAEELQAREAALEAEAERIEAHRVALHRAARQAADARHEMELYALSHGQSPPPLVPDGPVAPASRHVSDSVLRPRRDVPSTPTGTPNAKAGEAARGDDENADPQAVRKPLRAPSPVGCVRAAPGAESPMFLSVPTTPDTRRLLDRVGIYTEDAA